ncbi:MAG: NHL repeat-containing protein [Planctomyces sp.]|nr:NHL repeat-containing protein [Planctomyces sp.]
MIRLLQTTCMLVLTASVSLAQDTSTATEFEYPLAVVSPAEGTAFVADRNLPGVWKVENGTKTVFFQGSKKFRTPLNAVRCLALDHQGKLLAGDSATREVYRFGDDGKPVPLTSGAIGIPMGIAVATDGTIYVADLELQKVWKFPSAGSEKPEEVASIIGPKSLTFDGDGNLLVLNTSDTRGQILKVLPDGKVEPVIQGQPFSMPHHIVRSEDGTLFVTDNYEHCIWQVTPDAMVQQWISGAPLDRPVGLCRSGSGMLVADPHIRTIFTLAQDKSLTVFAGSPVP